MDVEKAENNLSSLEMYHLMSKAHDSIAGPEFKAPEGVETKMKILLRIEIFVQRIAFNSIPAFTQKKIANKHFYLENQNQPLHGFIGSFNSYVRGYSRNYIFSPHVGVFFDCCKDMEMLRDIGDNDFSAIWLDDELDKFEKYNTLIFSIAKKLESSEFKSTLNKRVQNSKKNYASLCLYEQQLFESYETLMILRVDFTYHDSQAQYVTLERAKKDLKRFKDNTRNNRRLFLHQVGYIWRLEYGERKGYYFRMIFFFDEKQMPDDVKLAEGIGEYWSKHINAESTVTINDQLVSISRNFINYNSLAKDKSKDSMAILHRNDAKLRGEFRRYELGYIAKADQFLMIKGKKGRSFDTGRL